MKLYEITPEQQARAAKNKLARDKAWKMLVLDMTKFSPAPALKHRETEQDETFSNLEPGEGKPFMDVHRNRDAFKAVVTARLSVDDAKGLIAWADTNRRAHELTHGAKGDDVTLQFKYWLD